MTFDVTRDVTRIRMEIMMACCGMAESALGKTPYPTGSNDLWVSPLERLRNTAHVTVFEEVNGGVLEALRAGDTW